MSAQLDSWRGVAAEEHEDVSASLGGFLRDRSRRLIGSLLRPHKGKVAWGSVLVVLNTAAVLAGPFLVKVAIDDGIRPLLAGGGSAAKLYAVVAAYVGIAIADAVTWRAYMRTAGRTGESILFDLRTRMFDHFERLSVSFHERYTSGKIIARLTSDIDALSEVLGPGLVMVSTSILSLVGITIMLLRLDLVLGAAMLIVFPVVLGLTWWFRRHSAVAYRASRSAIALVIVHFTESLGGIRAVHAYRRERRNQEIFEDLNWRYRTARATSIRLGSLYGNAIALVGDAATVGVLIYGGLRVLNGDMTIGVLTAFLLYMRLFFQPIMELSQLYDSFLAASSALEKLSGVLEEEPSVLEPTAPVALEHPRGEVRFEDVTFAYKERPILERLSFEVPAGQTIALVGATGAGKSTIARLVSRFYDPVEGRITLDGIDLRSLSEHDLRRASSMVTQEGFLFSGTVASNIAFGRPSATPEEIEEAARTVGAHEFISALPEGYDTDVRKRGGRLSSGQRQLVALARAFIADPHVLIFDEATSSIDLPSERLIQNALEVVLRDRTAFIIAHRLSTVEIADRVLVIDGGRIVEDGSPAELLAAGERWTRLHEAWLDSLA